MKMDPRPLTDHPIEIFRRRIELELDFGASCLELGTRRWGNEPTHHREWFPKLSHNYTMSDIKTGEDVDVVADAHELSRHIERRFDAIVACSVFEHLQRPWIAAAELVKTLRPGGLFFVQTHQTFPLHGYPSDYFRFSVPALETIFGDAGALDLHAAYEFPCHISAPANGVAADAFLNVCITGRAPK